MLLICIDYDTVLILTSEPRMTPHTSNKAFNTDNQKILLSGIFVFIFLIYIPSPSPGLGIPAVVKIHTNWIHNTANNKPVSCATGSFNPGLGGGPQMPDSMSVAANLANSNNSSSNISSSKSAR